MSNQQMTPTEAVALVLAETRPGGILDGFQLIEIQHPYIGHVIYLMNPSDPSKQQLAFNTVDLVIPDADWDQSPENQRRALEVMVRKSNEGES